MKNKKGGMVKISKITITKSFNQLSTQIINLDIPPFTTLLEGLKGISDSFCYLCNFKMYMYIVKEVEKED